MYMKIWRWIRIKGDFYMPPLPGNTYMYILSTYVDLCVYKYMHINICILNMHINICVYMYMKI
jgi:hypothetical protein